jgi:histidine phosphatase superfamily protein (branch 1)
MKSRRPVNSDVRRLPTAGRRTENAHFEGDIMSELRIVLVRHSPRRRDISEERAGLTERGRQEAQNLARDLKPLGIVFKHYFTSSRPHAKETAEILRSSVGERQHKS